VAGVVGDGVWKPLIEIVFFDAGETIVHPHPSFAELFARTCVQAGHPMSPGSIRKVQQRLAPHLLDIGEGSGVVNPTFSSEASFTFWTHLYERFCEELGIDDDELPGELYRVFSRSESYRLFDDVVPALEALAGDGVRLGLISNFEGWLEKMLVELEVGHLFEVSVISGTEGVEKPDPAIYELALDRAAVSPDRALHVGDAPKLDVEPAISVGMGAVLLDRTGRYSDFEGLRIRSLEELRPLVAKL
jgi:putative hydrolase of the HAD superfamily